MPEGSPARTIVAAALLLMLAAGAVWGILQWRAAPAGPASQAATSETAARTSSPSPPPATQDAGESPAPEPPAPTPDAEPPAPVESTEEPPDDGPATGPYAAFSPSHQLTHPDTDPDIRRWYDWFGYFIDDEVGAPSGEWTNKDELWDQLAPALAEEAQRLGEEISQPRFAGMEIVPAVVNVRWSNEDTAGRGELVEFSAIYSLANGDSQERYWPMLIDTQPDGWGEVAVRMEPFELTTSEFSSFSELRAEAGEREWEWVLEQPNRDR